MKAPYLTFVLSTAGLLCCSNANAAWVWEDWGGGALGDPGNPSGASGSFDLTPLYANYDDGPPANLVDRRGWDRTPEAFDFSWSSSNGEAIELVQGGLWTAATPNGYQFIDVYLDPDGDGSLPDTLTLTVTFPFDLVVRNTGSGGAIGLNVNPIAMTFGGTLDAYLGDGSQAMLDGTYTYGNGGGPTSFSPTGQATWDDISGNGAWHGLANGGLNTSTYFPWPDPYATTVPDQSKTLGQLTWTFSDFSDLAGTNERFRLSFDGGVPALAQAPISPVPEPFSAALLGLGGVALMLRRKRS